MQGSVNVFAAKSNLFSSIQWIGWTIGAS